MNLVTTYMKHNYYYMAYIETINEYLQIEPLDDGRTIIFDMPRDDLIGFYTQKFETVEKYFFDYALVGIIANFEGLISNIYSRKLPIKCNDRLLYYLTEQYNNAIKIKKEKLIGEGVKYNENRFRFEYLTTWEEQYRDTKEIQKFAVNSINNYYKINEINIRYNYMKLHDEIKVYNKYRRIRNKRVHGITAKKEIEKVLKPSDIYDAFSSTIKIGVYILVKLMVKNEGDLELKIGAR